MTITAEVNELRRAVAWASTAVVPKPPNPIMGAAVLEHDADGLFTISGFDYDRSATAIADVDGELERTLVPGHLLRAMLDQLEGRVTLELDPSKSLLNMRAGRARYGLRTMPADLYPTLPDLPSTIGSIGATDLREIMSRASTACSVDMTVPILGSVQLTASGGVLTAIATDRYRMHRVQFPWTGAEFSVIVPGRDFAELTKALEGTATVMLDEGGGIIAVADGVRSATIRLMGGEYPKVGALITDDPDEPRAVIGRDELIHATRAAGVVAGAKDPAVLMQFGPDGVAVSAAEEESGNSTVELNADTAAEQRIKVSVEYVTAGLGVLTGSHVQLRLPKNRAGKVTMHGMADPAGDINEAITVVVMSIREAGN